MADFYRRVNEEKSYHRAIFLAVSLAVAGLCSVYPMACFKKYSSKERKQLKRGVEELDRKKEEQEGRSRHHSRHRSPLAPRRVRNPHRPNYAPKPRRYRSSEEDRYNRELRRTEQELEMDPATFKRRPSTAPHQDALRKPLY